jgi:hypothetical protein
MNGIRAVLELGDIFDARKLLALRLTDKRAPGVRLVAWAGTVQWRSGEATLSTEPNTPDWVAHGIGDTGEDFRVTREQDAKPRVEEILAPRDNGIVV